MDLRWPGQRDGGRSPQARRDLEDINDRLVTAHRRALDDASRLRAETERLREENIALRELLRVERLERRRRRSHYERLLEAARRLPEAGAAGGPAGAGAVDEDVRVGAGRVPVSRHHQPEAGAVVVDLHSRRREPEPLVLDVDDHAPPMVATVSRLRPSS